MAGARATLPALAEGAVAQQMHHHRPQDRLDGAEADACCGEQPAGAADARAAEGGGAGGSNPACPEQPPGEQPREGAPAGSPGGAAGEARDACQGASPGAQPLEGEQPSRGGDAAQAPASPPAAPESPPAGEGSRERPAPRITLEMLSSGGFYDMPMAKAAEILGRTEGSFQRVCRGLGILRWPYRVRKSLQAIMQKTEEYLDDNTEEDGMSKAEVLRTLQARMDDIKGISGNGMDKATKQYRQYIFKLNHKLARRAARRGEGEEGAVEAGPLKARGILRAASRIQKQASPSRGGSSEDGSGSLARPKARHVRDLPGGGLALPTPGAAQPGALRPTRTATPEEYQKACLQDNLELIRLCGEMDKHLQAAQEALSMRGPYFPAGLPPALAAQLLLPPALAGLPAGLPAALPAGLPPQLQAAALASLAARPPSGWPQLPPQPQPPASSVNPGFWPQG